MDIKNTLIERYGDDYLSEYADNYESSQRKKSRNNSKYLWFAICCGIVGIYVAFYLFMVINNL